MLVLVLVCCCACNQHSTKPVPVNTTLLQGDWVNDIHIISVYDTLILTSYFGNYHKFDLINDTLHIRKSNGEVLKKYYVESVNKDSLILEPITTTLNKEYDKYLLHKLRTLEGATGFEKVNFTSTACEGGCPAMKVSIDKFGNLVYEGLYNVSKKGLYNYRFSEEQQEYFINKIRALSVDDLDSTYSSNIADNPVFELEFQYENKVKKVRTDGVGAPPALKLFITYLTNLYKIYDIKRED